MQSVRDSKFLKIHSDKDNIVLQSVRDCIMIDIKRYDIFYHIMIGETLCLVAGLGRFSSKPKAWEQCRTGAHPERPGRWA